MSETAVATHEVYRFKVGAFDCTVILDETGTDAADRLLALVPEEERKRVLAEQGLASDQITMTYNPLLIEVDGWRILLDSGNGVETGGDGRLLPTLAELGIALDSITDVVLTHAHADHYAGMLTASGDKVFPKARYIMWADEWAYYASDERMEIERQRGEDRHAWISQWFLPLQPYLTLLDEFNDEVVPGIWLIPAPGHTRHHAAVEIDSQGEKLIYTADAFVHPLFVEHPDWRFQVDFDPEIAAQTRRQLNELAFDQKALVLGYHFPFPGLGQVKWFNGDYRWEPLK